MPASSAEALERQRENKRLRMRRHARRRYAKGGCVSCGRRARPKKATCGRCGPYRHRPARDAVADDDLVP